MADNEEGGFFGRIRGNAEWDGVKAAYRWAQPVMFALAGALYQKLRHLDRDWLVIVLLFALGVLSSLVGYFLNRPKAPQESNGNQWKDKWHWKQKYLAEHSERTKLDAELKELKTTIPSAPDSQPAAEPPTQSGPQTPQELRERAWQLAGSVCAFLLSHGKAIGPVYVSDGFGGLGDHPEEPEIKNGFQAFNGRLEEIRNRTGNLGLLDEPFEFSSIGDALNGSLVRNSDDVRTIIRCLVYTAKRIDERFISGIPFALAGTRSAATLNPQEEAFRLAKDLELFLERMRPCPTADAKIQNGTREGVERFLIETHKLREPWESQLVQEYAEKFAPRVRGLTHRLKGSVGLTTYGLVQYRESVRGESDIESLVEILKKIAMEAG